ncbi:hypothetical protein CMU51_02325 [Elizabethkingia anophelis]|uniref:Uncharacterized protein n=1 Tax=Elizabethkingia anophelis TaxID=1117645 RepID=A0AAE4SZT9_9FLAO|nr:hypothetical protein [Elizabethkingia anophelis]
MINFETTKIRLYENLIRDIINIIVNRIDFEKLENENKLFLTKIKERLCFDNDNAWKFLVSSLDTVGDSQFAIVTFQNHKIEKVVKFNTGENYLRLYGVLSAVYIQQQAILKLSDLFKVRQIDELKSNFDNLQITHLRHFISAHPINFNKNGKKVSFRIDRNSLNDNGLLSIRDEYNKIQTYNIYETLDIYILEAEKCLKNITHKLIHNCYKTSVEKFDELMSKLEKI